MCRGRHARAMNSVIAPILVALLIVLLVGGVLLRVSR